MASSGPSPRRRPTATLRRPRWCSTGRTSTAGRTWKKTSCPRTSRLPRASRPDTRRPTRMSHAAAADTAPAEPGLGVYTQKLGMWVFLCSEIMFFTALIGSYIILRWGASTSWPVPAETLNIPVTALNTFILICSSVSMVKAYVAAVHDNQPALKGWLLTTVAGGATFVGVQAFEYRHLMEKGFFPSTSQFGSTFYTMTGFHGFHVTCGVI